MRSVTAIVLLSASTALPATAQAVTAAMVTGRMQRTTQTSGERISVAFENIPLSDAIWTVARRVGSRATFDRSILPARRVTYRANNVTPEAVFAVILNGTGLRASRLPSGTFVVARIELDKRTRVQGTVTGKVTDGKTGKGIPGATVSVENEAQGVVTGTDGSYRLTGIATGPRTVTVRLIGYTKQSRSVTVEEASTVGADFTLEPSASVLNQVVVTGTIVQTELKAVPSAITVVTAKQIEERGITRIDQLFRGDIPGLVALNKGSSTFFDEVTMFSRGATALSDASAGIDINIGNTNPIKTYVDGVELADAKYLSQIDPKSIERIEILTGPQASTIYGSNAINGVMQVFTKRGMTSTPQLTLNMLSGWVENNFSSARTPQHDYSAQLSGMEGSISYNTGGSWNYMGPWTPAKQSARTSGFGGARLSLPTSGGSVTADVTLRRTWTQNVQRGRADQTATDYVASGWYTTVAAGRSAPAVYTLAGQTLGLSLSYTLRSWWSHELMVGSDVSDAEMRSTARGYIFSSDTTLFVNQTRAGRRSLRYATTARVPVATLGQLTLTAGIDAWQSLASSLSVSPQALTGTLSSVNDVSRQPGHNTGGFVQAQLGFKDRLFFTHGLRMEKNPTIGENARVVPGRYGMAYTQELGVVTAKLRGSYGRAVRPPQPTFKNPAPETSTSRIARYGPYDLILANPDLTPEYQQGGEGGVELYIGTRGSLVVTRYNQTIDRLIAAPSGVDSVRSLTPCPLPSCTLASSSFRDAEGYSYTYQKRFINLGNIRNQGWELQGSINTGPLSTRGTYSWTKSRTIGVDPKYRSFFNPREYPQYQPGATFRYLPEHTWAFGVTYAHARSNVGLNLMGLGRATTAFDQFYMQNLNFNIRLAQDLMRMNATSSQYINFNAPYALADLVASHRFSSRLEALLRIQNLGDRYTNDTQGAYASLGRQTMIGFTVKTR